MHADFLSKELINTGRQREIDFLKAYSIIMMILTHCIDDLFVYEEHFFAELLDDILAQAVGAQGFMICMGLGIVYSSKTSARDFFKRGISLLMVGQLLNLFRYALPYIIMYIVSGDSYSRAFSFLTFSSDILQFAGFTFLLLALLTKLKLKHRHIFIFAIALNILGMILAGKVNTGLYPLDQFFGLFFFTHTESYFPLFHWFIFVAFGSFFGNILQHVKDKNKFYLFIFVPGALISAFYFYVGLCVEQSFFTVFSTWQSFCYMRIYDAIFQLVCNATVISICYFITKQFSDSMMIPVHFISKNINRYYCVHSFIIYTFAAVMAKTESFLVCLFLIAVVITLTTLIILLYQAKLVRPLLTFFGKKKYVWYALIIIASVAVCVWAGNGINWDYESFPNLSNEYFWK